MTEAEYIFFADCAEKKKIGHSAYSHAKSRGGVKMPCDFMSQKERNAMNGEVKTYNFSKPMKWKQFKSMPGELRREYLEYLDNNFHPSRKQIAVMFGVSEASVYAVINELHMKPAKRRRVVGGPEWYAYLNPPAPTEKTNVDAGGAYMGTEAPAEQTAVVDGEKSPCGLARGVFEYHDVTPDMFGDICTMLKVCMRGKCKMTICLEESE